MGRPLKYLVLLFCLAVILPGQAQISEGGRPLSFDVEGLKAAVTVSLPAPDLQAISREDEQLEKDGNPQRVAVCIPVGASLKEYGSWETTREGSSVWRLRVECPGARAMNVSFDKFHLSEGARLYVYDDEQDFLIGAFTTGNNKPNGQFATELIPGDALTIELNIEGGMTKDLQLSVGDISFLYRFFPEFIGGRGVSDDCEVNINCPEGQSWQKQKRAVARIYVKSGLAYFWCTGSLINNARMDRTPYFLTADHCASNVSADDLSKWVFYFNYEAPGCENPSTTPIPVSMTGATLRASADASAGSDFMLVELDNDVPESFSPYFMGWNSENVPGQEGVSIHHPAGDIKKISTYTEPVTSSQWSGTPNTHWQVYWSETESGWGVTEGGSSGAPLLNENGMVIGTLTGGLAACEPGSGGPGTGPDKPDYYAKFSYSWDQNGTTADSRLKDWLDPDNTGVKFLAGMNTILTADFITENRLILTGNSITFSDLSSGPPSSWTWLFEGGDPETFSGKTPPEIYYSKGGKYDVRLIVSDGTVSDTLTRLNYVEVIGQLYPNPTREKINIYLGDDVPDLYKVEVINQLGQLLFTEERTGNESSVATIDLSSLPTGVYFVRLQVRSHYIFSKVLLMHE